MESQEELVEQTYFDIPDFKLLGRHLAIRCDSRDGAACNRQLAKTVSGLLRQMFKALTEYVPTDWLPYRGGLELPK